MTPKQRLLAACAFAGAAAATFPAYADYKAGMDALAVRDYATARTQFESEPENPEAIYQLSVMAGRGIGEPRNDSRAVGLLERAAAKGHSLAKLDLAFALGNGRGAAKDPARAVKLLEELAAENHLEGTTTLAKAVAFGWWGLAPDETRGAALFKKSAERGDLVAKTFYGAMLVEGKSVPKDEAEGVRLVREAADAGSSTAQAELARLMFRGEAGLKRDDAEIFALYKKAAEQGNPGAQSSLARQYWQGWGVARDPEAAVRWADAAARQGDGWAMVLLSDAYHTGVGVPAARTEAFYWLTVASSLPSTAANAANERRAMLAKDMPQAEIDSVMKRAALFAPQPGFRPRAQPLPPLSHTDSVQVGGTRISLPLPPAYGNGYQNVEWLQRLHPNDPNLQPLLMVMTRQEDLDRFKLGLQGPYRCIEVAEYASGSSSVNVTPELFADIRKQLRKVMEASVAAGKYKVEEVQRDDDSVFAMMRSGIAQADMLDGMAVVLVKQKVLWFKFTGFTPANTGELKQLMRSSVNDFVAANRGLFGG